MTWVYIFLSRKYFRFLLLISYVNCDWLKTTVVVPTSDIILSVSRRDYSDDLLSSSKTMFFQNCTSNTGKLIICFDRCNQQFPEFNNLRWRGWASFIPYCKTAFIKRSWCGHPFDGDANNCQSFEFEYSISSYRKILSGASIVSFSRLQLTNDGHDDDASLTSLMNGVNVRSTKLGSEHCITLDNSPVTFCLYRSNHFKNIDFGWKWGSTFL